MYDKCFERIEEKYLITDTQKQSLLAEIQSHVVRDKHFRSNMRNVYFDTHDFDLITRANEKPVFKDKFRVRTYEDPAKSHEVFLEMKMKYKGISHKRRTKLSFDAYEDFVRSGRYDETNVIWREINYYFRFYDLQPMMYIAYDRESYASAQDGSLRITFDANLRSRTEDFDLTNDDDTEGFFKKPMYIMEIKTVNALPLWLVRALWKFEICPTSFSKYGQIYQRRILQNE